MSGSGRDVFTAKPSGKPSLPLSSLSSAIACSKAQKWTVHIKDQENLLQHWKWSIQTKAKGADGGVGARVWTSTSAGNKQVLKKTQIDRMTSTK
jgi:hypothetical protein